MKDKQKEFFDTAYRTGSDIWTHIPYHDTALKMLPRLESKSMILDLGAGRGIFAYKLMSLGYRVLGIDYSKEIVSRVNKDIQERGFLERARFIVGDVREIPFTDQGFIGVTDIGVLQHLPEEDWETYVKEVSRVLKKGGYFLNVSLSRETVKFLDWAPKTSPTGAFEKFDVQYYFFTKEELQKLFGTAFTIENQIVRFFETRSDPDDAVGLVFTLCRKK